MQQTVVKAGARHFDIFSQHEAALERPRGDAAMQKFPVVAVLGLLCAPAAAQGFDPPVAVDVDPDPDVVEVKLEAKAIQWSYFPSTNPTVMTTVWAYGDQTSGNFSVPGPTIEAKLGDTVRVHFKNSLPEPTTISPSAGILSFSSW